MARRSGTRDATDARYPAGPSSPGEEIPPRREVEGGPDNPLELGKAGWGHTLKRSLK